MNLRNIHPKAKIGKNVKIDPFVTIEEDVEIGDNTWIGPNAVVMNGTGMGEGCKIYPAAIVGGDPQDKKFGGEYSTLEIGNNVVIREFCTLNKGTVANNKTVVGDDCLLMAYVHIAHDCVLGSNCVLSNGVTLAGHIEVDDWAVIGGLSAVHQFVKIGEHTMVGGGSLVRKDIPPYVKAAREPLSYAGINSIGLSRRGFSSEQMHRIQDIYRLLFVKGLNYQTAVEAIQLELPESPEKTSVLSFLDRSDRGIMKGYYSKK